MTVIQDDRTDSQRITHRWGVVGRDTFLSGWGRAEGGYSRAAWAATIEDLDRVERWVRSRADMQYVNVVDLNKYRAARGTAHLHIYVVGDNHPARAS